MLILFEIEIISQLTMSLLFLPKISLNLYAKSIKSIGTFILPDIKELKTIRNFLLNEKYVN